MPPVRRRAFVTQAFRAVDAQLAALFTEPARAGGHSSPRGEGGSATMAVWNTNGMRRFGTDVDALLQFAGRHRHERTFAKLDDLVSFLTREQWHLAANPDHLTASYPNIDPNVVRAFSPKPGLWRHSALQMRAHCC